MAMLNTVCELEIDQEHNQNLLFLPLGRKLRGRFDLARAAQHDRDAAGLFSEWGEPIPGQRLRVNFGERSASLIEPLRDSDHRKLLERAEKRGEIEPARQDFADIDAATWLFWLKRAIAAGQARIVAGELPESLPGKPQLSFFVKREADPNQATLERLATAIERQGDLLAQLVGKLAEGKPGK